MEALQVYTHPADPDFLGFQPGSVFQGSTVNNLLPPGEYYYRYELVEGVRSMLSAALQGENVHQHKGVALVKVVPSQSILRLLPG